MFGAGELAGIAGTTAARERVSPCIAVTPPIFVPPTHPAALPGPFADQLINDAMTTAFGPLFVDERLIRVVNGRTS